MPVMSVAPETVARSQPGRWLTIVGVIACGLILVAWVLWRWLPVWAPDFVLKHSPWVEPMARAVVADPKDHFRRADIFSRFIETMGEPAGPALPPLLAHADGKVRILGASILLDLDESPAWSRGRSLYNFGLAERLLYGLDTTAQNTRTADAMEPLTGALRVRTNLTDLRRAGRLALARLHALDLTGHPDQTARLLAVDRIWELCFQYGCLSSRAVTDLLRAGLDDREAAVRCMTVYLLGMNGDDPRVARELIRRLGTEPDPETMRTILAALKRFKLDDADRAAFNEAEKEARIHLRSVITSGIVTVRISAQEVLRSLLHTDEQRAEFAKVLEE